MGIIQAVVLGVEQGLSEFLPISSSGHLILTPILFGWADQGIAFDTVLHLGTLAAVIWFFRKDLFHLARHVFQQDATGRAARLFIAKVAVATVPALAAGLLFADLVETYARHAGIVAFDLAFWALVLLAADRWSEKKKERVRDPYAIGWKHAIFIGCAQAVALIPGTSRSGITMTAGLLSGLDRPAAARFSFLLSIPVTAAAGAYGVLKLATHGAPSVGAFPLAFGFLCSLAAGLFAIRFLLSFVSRHRYDPFVVYRLALACVVLVLV